ncbi:bifunctional UDP-sugar hydrolase/5'-nucleotidase [Anaerorhabdus sp.]|uniref:bifunctional metallophosphatase/5'-nucleotidase n=1 Tax=Anaerorhabdus sp. TaxID=1872524 RepID=UPI002B2186F6|nr:bifunctional UDP-sugar hydrolase/5'-nucleotidase [Anaerorhabdus sp.]MEA4873948.1 bifunctional UDP-sugar hydrolase/5'-nucleotidase [Anaerorhabdus sp.]
MKRISKILLAIVLIFTLSSCTTSSSKRTKDIAILYTGDVHVNFDSAIGYDGLAAFKNELIADNVDVILVDTGDAIQGTPIGKLSSGSIPIEVMNELGYDAMTLGNHEFDYGQEDLKLLSELATFPFLSVNFVDVVTEQPVYQPYKIVERDGIKVGFIGISTPRTITSSTPIYFQNEQGEFIYSFMQDDSGEKLWTTVQNTVDAVRKEGVDYVVAMAHLGIDESTSPYLSTTLIEKTRGIDVVLDGHSHSVVECMRVKNMDGERILLTSTGSGLENIGYLLIDKKGNISTGLIAEVEDKDLEMTTFVQARKDEFEKILMKPVKAIENDLVIEDSLSGNRIIRTTETNLGDLCADAFKEATGAQIAIQNGGGIRKNLMHGEITYGDILNVLPYGNQLCVIEATGQQILDALELSVYAIPAEFGGFLQVAGLTFEYDSKVPTPVVRDENNMFLAIEGERRVKNVKVNGETIDPTKTYTVGGPEYTLLQNGDGYAMFNGNKVIASQITMDYDAVVNYFNNQYEAIKDMYMNPSGTERIIKIQ